MVFTGKTKNLGVIGYPIKHSLSLSLFKIQLYKKQVLIMHILLCQ